LVGDSRDYYDLKVVLDDSDPTNRCNYIIDCNAYRLEGGEKIGRSDIRANLRIDPCIAYWVGSSTTISPQVTINGDVYCAGDLTNNGVIGGDVFATGTIAGVNIEGQKQTVTEAPVAWPGLISADFGPMYYIGSTLYSVEPNVPTTVFGPSPDNPAGICYCVGDVNMPGGVTINGTLVVTGSLTISGENTITAVKNFPALLVDGQVVMKNGSLLKINGLAQVEQQITVDPNDPNTTNANINVTGSLLIHSGGITSNLISVNVTASPAAASIQTWPAESMPGRWKPAAGAFFRSIERR